MLIFYNLFIRLYFIAIRISSLWNKKAAAWIAGRKHVFETLEKSISKDDDLIWVHCSSAGEFEQGKPVIEALKKDYPKHKILVSFFSPSGYNVAKKYTAADIITYLPLDTRKNAERFIKLVNPDLVIFVKYEYWYHHLSVVAFHHIPLLLVSAVFRKDQIFFKSYGRFFKQMLFLFRNIFVQDEASLALLHDKGIYHCNKSGDTRFDRVKNIADHFTEIAFIRDFIGDKQVMVAGSTWESDESVLAEYLQQNSSIKLIIAPHEINASHIESIITLFHNPGLYSTVSRQKNTNANQEGTIINNPIINNSQVLIIDSVGLLSRLYAYATVTYVGGGFTSDGIHNILEAAAWGKPVLFGPNHKKYREGSELIAAGGGFSFRTADEFKKIADDLFNNENHLQQVGFNARRYIEDNTGATQKILEAIHEKRLLTN